MRRIVLSFTLLTLLYFSTGSALGQDKEGKPALAGAGGAAGIGQYPPLSWGVVASTIVNPTDTDQKLLVTFNFDDTSTLQFASQVWVPPQSRRTVWLPIRTNSFEIDPFKPRTLPLTQQLFDMNGSQPVMLSQQQGLLIASRDHWITGMLSGGGEGDDEAEDDSINAALAMRQSMDLSRRMAFLRESALPSMVAGWRGLSSLVISAPQPALDAAQTAAVRQWLLGGGRLWIMVDRVDPAFMSALLGDAWTLRVIDRVPLDVVKIEPSPKANMRVAVDDDLNVTLDGKMVVALAWDDRARPKSLEKFRDALRPRIEDSDDRDGRNVAFHFTGGVPGQVVVDVIEAARGVGAQEAQVEREHERPVDLVRVVAPDMEVVHTVNGWPASLRKPVGQGWLMVTTMAPRGWMEPVLTQQVNVDGSEVRNEKNEPVLMHNFAALKPMTDLAAWFQKDERMEPLRPQAFDAFLSEQIGYEIVSRQHVMLVFGVFLAALLLNGFVLAKRGALEHLGWIAAMLAVAASVALIAIGRSNQGAVPLTVAQGQFVQIAPDQQHAVATGLITIYNPGTGDTSSGAEDSSDGGQGDSNARLAASAGGLILPADLSQLGSRYVRMVWTDLDRWHWQNVTMPSGANRKATFEQVTPLDRPVSVTISFDESGVVGSYRTGTLGSWREPIIVTPVGTLATRPAGSTSAADATKQGDPHDFVAAVADALPTGQFSASTVLDDAQRRRQELLRVLVHSAKVDQPQASTPKTRGERIAATTRLTDVRGMAQPAFPQQPTLLAWADLMPTGFELPPAQKQLGESLISVPLVIQRPKSGTKVAIPSAFLPYRFLRTRSGRFVTPFDVQNRTWLGLTTGGSALTRFQVPRELLPMRIEEAKFTLDVNCPGRSIEVRIERGGKTETLIKRENVTGVLEVVLPADAAQPDAEGGIAVTVTAGDGAQTMWQIRDVKLELKGTIGP